MQFAHLANYFQDLEKTSSRLTMTELLAVLMSQLSAEEIKPATYLLLGGLGPAYDRVDFQLAEKMVVRALAQAGNIETAKVWEEYKSVGDLGTVAEEFKSVNLKVKSKTQGQNLSIENIYTRLLEIAHQLGQGSQERKLTGLANLLNEVEPLSAKYIVRIVLGRMRLGFSDKTIMDALSVLVSGGKSAREEIEAAYQIYPDIGEVTFLIKKYGRTGLKNHVHIRVGVPVMPALCQRLKSPDEMIEKMGEVFAEPKYDGTRVQIHVRKAQNLKIDTPSSWQVKTFTRNLEETTWMFPELLTALDQINSKELILDCEAVGYDPRTGKMLPFQETITRKRKHEVEAAIGRVPLKFNVFDLLYADGESWINQPLTKRQEKLRTIIKPGKVLQVVRAIRTDSPMELRNFHRQMLEQGYEGAVVKQINGTYEPGRRGFNWVKFKEVETATGKLKDTIDAVVMGFYRGRGKRTGFGLGAFLVGIKGKEEKIVTLAKIGTGLTDDQWRELKRRLDNQVSMEPPKAYMTDKSLKPDVWTEPKVVVEIAADEITKSPVHTAGYALRFPRLVRFRDDKDMTAITTMAELLAIKG